MAPPAHTHAGKADAAAVAARRLMSSARRRHAHPQERKNIRHILGVLSIQPFKL